MQWRNNQHRYGFVSIMLHWVAALTVFGLFALGYWMVGLGYYDTWYHRAPDIHKSIGMLLLALMVVRLVWRHVSPVPPPLPTHGLVTRRASKAGHLLLYFGLFAVMIAGYLISTADGVGVSVFGWFTVPASITGGSAQADVGGVIHKYAAWSLVIFAVLHGLAALKHHFIDRDRTLVRMLGR
jgi:cytochrome b561